MLPRSEIFRPQESRTLFKNYTTEEPQQLLAKDKKGIFNVVVKNFVTMALLLMVSASTCLGS